MLGMAGAVLTGEAGGDEQAERKVRRKTLAPHASAGEKEVKWKEESLRILSNFIVPGG